jgi:hypothetical protein
MIRARLLPALLCLPALAMPALSPLPAAAQLRSVAVPAEAGVVVAPRGQAAPRLAAPPRSVPVAEAPAPVVLPSGTGLMGVPLIGALLPAAAGALLGSGLAGGGGGGGGGPVRTR